MSAVHIENGKTVEDLLEVSKTSNSSYFLMGTNGLSRKISITNLRKAFNGDSATSNKSNLYYSCEKVDEFLDSLNNEMARLRLDMSNIDSRLNSIYNNFGSDLSELRNYVNSIYNELKLADDTTNQKLNQSVTNLTNRIDTEVNNINNTINTKIKQITDKIDTVDADHKKLISNEISNRENADAALDTKIGEVRNDLNTEQQERKEETDQINTKLGEIVGVVTTITKTISAIEREIETNQVEANKKILAINNILNQVTKFSIGDSVPTSLQDGEVYFQYF